MNSFILLRGPFALLFICLICGDGWGATAKVDCLAEKEQLMTHEAEQCGGFGYIFNPSGCIRARNELAAFSAKRAASLPGTNCRNSLLCRQLIPLLLLTLRLSKNRCRNLSKWQVMRWCQFQMSNSCGWKLPHSGRKSSSCAEKWRQSRVSLNDN